MYTTQTHAENHRVFQASEEIPMQNRMVSNWGEKDGGGGKDR